MQYFCVCVCGYSIKYKNFASLLNRKLALYFTKKLITKKIITTAYNIQIFFEITKKNKEFFSKNVK